MTSELVARGRRILVISNDRDYFLHHRRAIVERLVELGAEVTVLAGGRQPDAAEDAGWVSFHLPIERLSINPFRDLLLMQRALRHVMRVDPDAAHLLTLKPGIYGGFAALLARSFGKGPGRILVTIPGLGRLMSPGGTGAGRMSSTVRWLVAAAIRFLSGRRGVRFSFETAHDRSLWMRDGLVREDNSTVINGAGCDPAVFFPAPLRKPDGVVRILYASRLMRAKGLGDFVAAARSFAGSGGVEFLVAGTVDPADPDAYPLAELERDASLTFLGAVKDMPSLLREVDIVCLPTRYGEGVPRILIEAAASGVACIATDIDGCKEIVEDGVTGTLVPTADPRAIPQALAAAISKYLDDPTLLAKHGSAGLKRFRARGFSQKDVVDAFVAQLLGGLEARKAP